MLLYWPNKDDSFPIGHILINWKALWNSADVHMCMCVKQLEALRVSGMLALACWEKINGPWYILSWWKSVCQHDTTCAGECDRLSTHYTLVCVGGMGLRNYVCTSVCTVHMSRSVHRWKKVSRCFSTEHGTSCAYFKSSVHKYKIKKINHLSQSLIWITNVRLKKIVNFGSCVYSYTWILTFWLCGVQQWRPLSCSRG